MDQFGVLVESIGFKAYGKSSAPLADLKGKNKTDGFPRDIGINQSNSNNTSSTGDGDFRSSSQNSGFDDVFGGFAVDSVFKTSSSNLYNDDDVFGLMKTSSGSSSGDHFDVLGNKVSPVVKTNAIDDLLGGMGGNNTGGNLNANFTAFKKNSVKKQEAASDLLSDFTSSVNGRKSEANPGAKSFSTSAEDPFGMFEGQQGSSYNGASVADLDSFFSPTTRSNTRVGQSSTTQDSVYDALFNNNAVPKQQNKATSVNINSKKQAPSKANSSDDFSYLFGMGVAPTSGEFQEIEGESDERRKARFNHHMSTQKRMNDALNAKTKRDLQAQQEQDEKHRVAATLDGDIKRWAVGKEGNLRALLSSLQHVLWAGSGWQPISLTDLITSTAVKKAYYKATLCVHPDKVQQKGASVQQKYIAEKVFDLLKESWNKFNAEEFKKH